MVDTHHSATEHRHANNSAREDLTATPATSAKYSPPTANRRPDRASQSALDAAQRAFDQLVATPAPLAFDCRDLDPVWNLPRGLVPLEDLPALATGACWDARDAMWQRLIARVRAGDRQWLTVAIGVALPTLKQAAARIGATYVGDPADIDAEVLTGFLHALHHIQIGAPRLAGRLTAAAYRAGWKAHHADLREHRALCARMESHPPRHPYGHPDLLLGRAVTLGYLTADDAALISLTCLDGQPVPAVADRFGATPQALRMRRQRAARHLADVLHAGHLSDIAAEEGSGRARIPDA